MYIDLQALLATSAFEGFDTFDSDWIEAHGEEAHRCRMAFVTETTINAAGAYEAQNGSTWVQAQPGDLIVASSCGSDSLVFERIRYAEPRGHSLVFPSDWGERFELVPFLGKDLILARDRLRNLSKTETPLVPNLLRAYQQLEEIIVEIAEEPAGFDAGAAEYVLFDQLADGIDGLGWNLYGNEFVNKVIADRLKADFARHYPEEARQNFPVARLNDVLSMAQIDSAPVALSAASEERRVPRETQAIGTVLKGLTSASESEISSAPLTSKQVDLLDLVLRRERLTGGWCEVIRDRAIAALTVGHADSGAYVEFYAYQGCDLLVVEHQSATCADVARVYSWPTATRHRVVDLAPGECGTAWWNAKLSRLLALSPQEGLTDCEVYQVLCLSSEDA